MLEEVYIEDIELDSFYLAIAIASNSTKIIATKILSKENIPTDIKNSIYSGWHFYKLPKYLEELKRNVSN